MHYDLVIIGAGICGLYHAYKFLKQNPNKSCCIIEKEKEIGGRAKQIYFNETLVPSGAGVGRFKKDKTLYKLIKELQLPSYTFITKPNYDNINPIDINKTINKLKKLYSNEEIPFKEFALKHMSKEDYNNFVDTCGFSDFENLQAYEALYNYGFDDLYGERKLFSVPWNDLMQKLENIITKTNKIYFSTTIKELSKNQIILSNNSALTYSDYIITIPPAQIDFKIDIPKNIFHQPFAYVYAKITTPEFVEKFKTYTIVPRPLQKIIPMSSDNIFMVGYADNESALIVKNIKSKKELTEVIYKTTKIKVNIINYKIIFREIGTHYRTEKYKHNKHFKGEAYALNQGWTNGGLK